MAEIVIPKIAEELEQEEAAEEQVELAVANISTFAEALACLNQSISSGTGKIQAFEKALALAATPMEMQNVCLLAIPYSEEWNRAWAKRWELGRELLAKISTIEDCLALGGCIQRGSQEQIEFYQRWDEISSTQLLKAASHPEVLKVFRTARCGSEVEKQARENLKKYPPEEDE